MRPKERYPQTQSSRLYLRTKDHRDIVLNDKYINALWLKKEQDGKMLDELVWCRYPKKYALYRTNSYMPYGNDTFGYYDYDRQICHGTYQNRASTMFMVKLKDYVVRCNYYSSTDYSTYISKDGCVWKKTNVPFISTRTGRFGENQICRIDRVDTYKLGIHIFEIKDFDTDDFNLVEVEYKEFTTASNQREFRYLCDTNEGCVVGVINYETVGYIGYYNLNTYKIDPISVQEGSVPRMRDFQFRSAINYYGQYMILFKAVFRDVYTNPFMEQAVLLVSSDGVNWESKTVDYMEGWSSYSDFECAMVTREPYTYIYVATNTELKVFRTSVGDVIEQIETPESLSIKCGWSGTGTTQMDEFNVQLKIKNTADDTESTRFNLWDVLKSSYSYDQIKNDGSGNLLMCNGEHATFEEGLGMCIRDTNNAFWHFFFDNNTFQDSELNYSWKSDYWDGGKAESIMQNDYCVDNAESEV